MSAQECALYGELVRHLRDRCIDRIAELDPAGGKDAAKAWADQVIRDWFFAPQSDLHGDAPRDRHLARTKGRAEHRSPRTTRTSCSLTTARPARRLKELDLQGEWHWGYDDGGYPLIAEYDPQGWDARWAADVAAFKPAHGEQPESKDDSLAPKFPVEDLPDLR